MKKLLLCIIFTLSFTFCYAQNFPESEKLNRGDLTLLETDISDLALAKMNNSELRLLRNMIFAKYGHKFDSKDLQSFFMQFEWYKPVGKVSDSEFTKREKSLAERIKIFETRNENIPSLNFGQEIIGLWHETPVMPDTWCDRFLIYPDNEMEFLISYFQENPEVKEYVGNYKIKGNVLSFSVEKIKKSENYISLEKPLFFNFPVTQIKEMTFGDGKLIRQMIQIGSSEYYRYSNDIETMGKWSREY